GYLIEKELIKGIALVKKAAALANMEIGRLDLDIGNAIVTATDDIIAGNLHDQFVVDPIQGGAGTYTNMNATEVIANRALEILVKNKGEHNIIHLHNHVNIDQSTNHAFPTAIHVSTL